MQRTTVVLPDDLMTQLRHEARRRDTSITEVVRGAVEKELAAPGGPRRLSFIGIGSGPPLSPEEIDEELGVIYEERARRRGQ